MARLDVRATDREELMTITLQTVHASWVRALSVHRTLKQAITHFQGQTFRKQQIDSGTVSVLVLVRSDLLRSQVIDYTVYTWK